MTYTEDEIREVMEKHHFTTGDQGERHGLCVCRYYSDRPAVEYSTDHFLHELRAIRERDSTRC